MAGRARPPDEAPDRRKRISRDQIIDAALALVQRDTVGQLTMRKLATELRVEPMSLYHHIPGKAALLAAMADRSLSQLPPSRPGLSWDDRLVDLMVDTYRAGTENPIVFEVLASPPEVIVALPRLGAAAPLGFVERVLELLHEGGLAIDDQVPVYRGLIGLVVGFIVADAGGGSIPAQSPDDGEIADPGVRFRSIRPLLEGSDPAPDLRLNLHHLLDGFLAGAPNPLIDEPESGTPSGSA